MIEKIQGVEIIERYKIEEIETFLKEKKLMDFIPAVKLKKDIEILYLWRDYFRKLKIPYAITKGSLGVILWKEEVVKGDKV